MVGQNFFDKAFEQTLKRPINIELEDDGLVSVAFIEDREFPKPYRLKANIDGLEKLFRKIIASSEVKQAATSHFALYSSAVFAFSCFVKESIADYLVPPLFIAAFRFLVAATSFRADGLPIVGNLTLASRGISQISILPTLCFFAPTILFAFSHAITVE